MNKETNIRSIVAMLSDSVSHMCNTDSLESVNEDFLKIKDMIINIYKYNIDRIKNEENT